MLEHQKNLLEGISYDEELFRKEIIKSFRFLKSFEILQLHFWLKKNYGNSHGEIIKDIFQYIAA
jgi:hypothetical protein